MIHSESTYRNLFLRLLPILLLFASISLDAQEADKKLKTDEIEDLVDLAKYDKTVKRLKSRKRDKAKNAENLEKEKDKEEEYEDVPEQTTSGNSFDFYGTGPILTGIIYLIIIALVVFLVVAIFSSIKVEKKIENKPITKEEEIEDIEVIDAESGLETALKAENYREAVRMLFIKLLQILVLEESIKWKPEKTNRDYLREMGSHAKIHHFNNLVIAYERIWYGRDYIDKPFFDFLRADFEKFYSTENVRLDVQE